MDEPSCRSAVLKRHAATGKIPGKAYAELCAVARCIVRQMQCALPCRGRRPQRWFERHGLAAPHHLPWHLELAECARGQLCQLDFLVGLEQLQRTVAVKVESELRHFV